MQKWVIILGLSFFTLKAQGLWYEDNLKEIETLNLEFNLHGIEDNVWEKRITNFIELRMLEHEIRMVKEQMPKLMVDVHIIDSRVKESSSFLVSFSILNYSVSEPNYYKSLADTLVTKKFMTSKIFSHEILGQTSSQNLYRDTERAINKLISFFLDQWYKDNPIKQF